MKRTTLNLIRYYQKYLSPDTGRFVKQFFPAKTCRYQPTCSNYMYQAIERYGIIKGFFLGSGRIIRCNPFAKGGYDPVPQEENSDQKTEKSKQKVRNNKQITKY